MGGRRPGHRGVGLQLQMMDEARTYAQLSTGDTTLAFADETAAVDTGLDLRRHRPGEHPAAVQLAFVHTTSPPPTSGR